MCLLDINQQLTVVIISTGVKGQDGYGNLEVRAELGWNGSSSGWNLTGGGTAKATEDSGVFILAGWIVRSWNRRE